MNNNSLSLLGQLRLVETRGYSAYEVAVLNGYTGTEEEWLASLVGPQGPQGIQGKSAYQVSVENGYIGTEEQWVNDFLTPEGYYNMATVDFKLNKKPNYYSNVQDMKNDNSLKQGDLCITTGYYSNNDGGGACYKVRTKTDEDTQDNGFHHIVGNLVFELVIENNTVNIKQLGARSQYKNNKYNIHDYIMQYIEYINANRKKYRLYIPAGYYYTTQCNIVSDVGFDIFGDFNFTTGSNKGTVISSFNDNQDYIFNIGDESKYTNSCRMTDINFSTLQKEYNTTTNSYNTSTIYKINNACLNLLYVNMSIFDNLFFIGIKGCAFSISSCWELYFKVLNFRYVDNLGDSIVKFLRNNYSLTDAPNISACTFENVMFERTHGSLFSVETQCSFGNNKFGTINFENSKWIANYLPGEYVDYNDDNIDTSVIGEYMFNLKSNCSFNADINDIVCNNVRNFYFTRNETNYSFVYFFRTSDNTQINAIVNNINIIGMKNNITILSNGSSNETINYKSSFIINNIILANSDYNILFSLHKMPYIRCNNIQRGLDITDNKYAFNIDGAIIPFYKSLVLNRNSEGKIFTMDGSISECNFATKISNDAENPDSFYIINNSDTLLIRAQIPANTTTVIKLKVGNYEGTTELVGTGSFKTYSIENIHQIINYPSNNIRMARMIISKVSGDENSFFDCYANV